MKRFLVFLSSDRYAAADWINCIGSANTRLELLTLIENKMADKDRGLDNSEGYWLQVVEPEAGKVSVFSFETEDFSLTSVQEVRLDELMTNTEAIRAAALEDASFHFHISRWPEDSETQVALNGCFGIKQLRAPVVLMELEEQEFQSKQVPI